jgi:hypothetical protein
MTEDRFITSKTAQRLILGILVAGVVIFVFLVLLSKMPVNHDSAQLLQEGELLVQGAVPYVDFVEIALPMSIYIHTLPVLVAGWTGTEVPMIFQFCVLLLVVCSGGLTYLIVIKSQLVATRAGVYFVLASWIWFNLFVLSAGTFGQREHLFVLWFMPWFFCREARHRGVPVSPVLSVPIGLMAGFIFPLKQYFILIAVGVELWMLLRARKFSSLISPELEVAVGLSIAYAAQFLLFGGRMRDAYLQSLPFVVANYNVYDSPVRSFLYWGSPAALCVLVAVMGVALTLVMTLRLSDTRVFSVQALAVGGILALLMFFYQHKGWMYHLVPAIGFLTTLVALALVMLAEDSAVLRLKGKRITALGGRLLYGSMTVLLVVLFVSSALEARYRASENAAFTRHFVEFLQEHSKGGDRVAFISTSVTPAYPALLYADRLPGTRYLCAFPIAMLYRRTRIENSEVFPYRKLGDVSGEERQFLMNLGSDIEKYRPSLVVVQIGPCQACPYRFGIDEYLRVSGWQDQFFSAYKPFQLVGDFIAYCRKDAPQSVLDASAGK